MGIDAILVNSYKQTNKQTNKQELTSCQWIYSDFNRIQSKLDNLICGFMPIKELPLKVGKIVLKLSREVTTDLY